MATIVDPVNNRTIASGSIRRWEGGQVVLNVDMPGVGKRGDKAIVTATRPATPAGPSAWGKALAGNYMWGTAEWDVWFLPLLSQHNRISKKPA